MPASSHALSCAADTAPGSMRPSSAMIVGVPVTPAILSEVSAALGDELEPQEDQEASAAMRRHLAKVLLARCVSALLDRPGPSGGQA